MKKALFITSQIPSPRFFRKMGFFETDGGWKVYCAFWNRKCDKSQTKFDYTFVEFFEFDIKASPDNPIKRIPQSYQFKKRVNRLISKIKPDITIIEDADMLIHFYKKCILVNSKIVYEVRDIHDLMLMQQKKLSKKMLRRYLIKKEKMALKHVDLLTSTSDAYYDLWFKNKIDRTKFLFIPNVPDNNVFDGFQKKNDGAFTIGFIGGVRYCDQLKMLIDVCCEKNINVFIAGDEHGDIIKKYSLDKKNVFYFGPYLYSKDIKKLYEKIDVIYSVYPTESINVRYAIPNRLFESIICGLPIIVSRGTFLSKIVNEAGIGYSIASNSKDELSACVDRLINKSNYDLIVRNCKKNIDLAKIDKYRKQFLSKISEMIGGDL